MKNKSIKYKYMDVDGQLSITLNTKMLFFSNASVWICCYKKKTEMFISRAIPFNRINITNRHWKEQVQLTISWLILFNWSFPSVSTSISWGSLNKLSGKMTEFDTSRDFLSKKLNALFEWVVYNDNPWRMVLFVLSIVSSVCRDSRVIKSSAPWSGR